MGSWPGMYQHRSPGMESGLIAANCRGIAVTPNASANTLGSSFVDVVTALAYPSQGFLIQFQRGAQAAGAEYLTTLYQGTAGNEQPLIDNILYTIPAFLGGTINFVSQLYIPVGAPRGTRISSKTQCTAASAASIGVRVLSLRATQFFQGAKGNLTIGADPTSTTGTLVLDSGESPLPAWTPLSGTGISGGVLTRSIQGFVIVAGKRANDNGTIHRMEIAVGSGASPTPIASFQFSTHPHASDPIMIPILAGSTIQARVINPPASPANDYSCILHGLL
jgi:hypothetical protein